VRQILTQFGLIGLLLFGAAGRLDWPAAWLYIAFLLTSTGVNFLLMRGSRRGLIAERAAGTDKTAGWDRRITMFSIPIGFSLYVIAGLDHRWTWSTPPAWLNIAGLLLIVGGGVFSNWAMLTNAFFSTGVRIQKERGHHVVDGGPYQFVRHPAYLGWSLSGIGIPLLLGSYWALLPAVLSFLLAVLRTSLEDRFLTAELPGYSDYAARVRYRLLPGLW
jgi:protein-S-isoprenylcysteine O-methyltransferase Ste14